MKIDETTPQIKGPGRPYLGVIRRGIALVPADYATLANYGFGSLSSGIRRAADLVRKLKGQK